MSKYKFLLPVSLSFLPLLSFADISANQFFSDEKPALTATELQALKLSEAAKNGHIKPFSGRDGSVNFVFGDQHPTIVCAVLQICDIALEPGEQINSIQLGDTARWNVSPAVSGVGSQTQHVIIKPLDVALNTSLLIATDRRSYHLNLVSDRKRYMSYVTFTYPGVAIAKFNALQTHNSQVRAANTLDNGEYLGNLDFNYKISGSAPWKPVRVYNDGKKTIIEMPSNMAQQSAPTLLVQRPGKGIFGKDQQVMVNYRVQGTKYVVDSIFQDAILISGVGSNQEKITISRSK